MFKRRRSKVEPEPTKPVPVIKPVREMPEADPAPKPAPAADPAGGKAADRAQAKEKAKQKAGKPKQDADPAGAPATRDTVEKRSWLRRTKKPPPKVSLIKVPQPKAPRTRAVLGLLFWLAGVIAALLLAMGTLYVTIEAPTGEPAVDAVLRVADWLDFGVLSREDGLFRFGGERVAAKDALANWGLAAIVWLVLGRLLDRLVRP